MNLIHIRFQGSYIVSKIEIEKDLVSHDDFAPSLVNPEEYEWDCPICRKPVSMDLKEHLPSHFTPAESENEPKCPICSQEFDRLEKLYSHIVAVHKNDRKRGQDDPEVTMEEKKDCITSEAGGKHSVFDSYDDLSSESLSDHFMDHQIAIELKVFGNPQKLQEPSMFLCEICGKELKTTHSLKIHLQRHSTEKPYKCSICEKSFVLPFDRQIHIKLVHIGNRPFQCEICGKSFTTKIQLQKHIEAHERKSAYERCNNCDRQVADLELHQRLCVEKSFVCSECPRSYDTKQKLAGHVHAYHKEDKSKSECPVCKKMLSTRFSMQFHLKNTHSNERSFACSLCERKFKNPAGVSYHMKKEHTENRENSKE